ncbi:MAG: hypothetical protein RL030_1656 [Pseudomonadota bacterium]
MKKKKLALCLLIWATALPLAHAAAPAVLDGLIRCAAQVEPQQRLACFDREIAPHVVAQRPATSTAPLATAAPAPAAPIVAQASAPLPQLPAATPAPTRALGEEQLPVDRQPVRQAEELALTARITSLDKAGSAFFVSLDNGQVWRHENSAQGEYLKMGESVTITRAALGSYRLTRDAGQAKNWIRVSRVR